MNWNLIKTINEFVNYSYHQWFEAIRLGYLINFSSQQELIVRQVGNYNIVLKSSSLNTSDLYYYIFEGRIYIRKKNELLEYQPSFNSFVSKCITNEDYITLLNSKICTGRTVSRRPKIYRAELIDLNTGNSFYNWNDGSLPIFCSEKGLVVLENNSLSILNIIDSRSGKELHKIELLGFNSPRFYKSISENLFLVMQSFDTDHPIDKRFELWGIDMKTGGVLYKSDVGHFDRFIYCEEKQKLFGLSGQSYLSVNPYTGVVVSSKELEGLGHQWALLGRQSITKEDIYFVISGKPLVGRFNIVSESIEEFIEIPVDESRVDMREPLNTPFYHDGRLYVCDNSGVMHILQNETSNPT